MAQPDLTERTAKLEEGKDACQTKQDERYKEIMSRIRRIEDRYNVLLLLMVGTLLGSLANIVLSVVLKK